MSVAFTAGQTTGQGDLDLFLQNSLGNPTNAYSITYSIYDNTTGVEILLPPADRTPVNPTVGEYYAAFMVSSGASLGDYIIRWSFRQNAGAPVQQVAMEFAVIDPSSISVVTYSATEQATIDRLRILLRDNCVGAEETVELDVDGEKMVVRMDDLWGAIHDVR